MQNLKADCGKSNDVSVFVEEDEMINSFKIWIHMKHQVTQTLEPEQRCKNMCQ